MSTLKHIFIRNLNEIERQAVNRAKIETGHKQASRAVMAVTCSFDRMVKAVHFLKEENNRLKRENKILKECVTCVMNTRKEILTIMEEDIAESEKNISLCKENCISNKSKTDV